MGLVLGFGGFGLTLRGFGFDFGLQKAVPCGMRGF